VVNKNTTSSGKVIPRNSTVGSRIEMSHFYNTLPSNSSLKPKTCRRTELNLVQFSSSTCDDLATRCNSLQLARTGLQLSSQF
jgi:hypothetical protein